MDVPSYLTRKNNIFHKKRGDFFHFNDFQVDHVGEFPTRRKWKVRNESTDKAAAKKYLQKGWKHDAGKIR